MSYNTPKVTIDLAEYNDLLEAKKTQEHVEQIQRFITLKHILTATPEESRELTNYLQSIRCMVECDYTNLVPTLRIYKDTAGGVRVIK